MTGPLNAEAIDAICSHMNDDHSDSVVHYARVFAHRPDADAARMTGFDSAGMDLELESPTGPTSVRIEFDHSLRDAEDARLTLIRMAQAGTS
jgi:putative heme iron utilization protein